MKMYFHKILSQMNRQRLCLQTFPVLQYTKHRLDHIGGGDNSNYPTMLGVETDLGGNKREGKQVTER